VSGYLTTVVLAAGALAAGCAASDSSNEKITRPTTVVQSVPQTSITSPGTTGTTDATPEPFTPGEQLWTLSVCRALHRWEGRINWVSGDIPGVIENLGKRLWPTARHVLLVSNRANAGFVNRIAGLPTGRIPGGPARRDWLQVKAVSISALTDKALAQVRGANPDVDHQAALIAADNALRLVLPPFDRLDGQFSGWMRHGEPVPHHHPLTGLGIAFRKLRACKSVRFN
jgi:hypothetical protein